MSAAGPFQLTDLKEFAEKFSAHHIDLYIQQLRKSSIPAARKEINDAVWGTISLTPAEVIILDSPLLQRLRYVRQLGVVHWIYPGAVHTRLEHTLGVLRQVDYLCTSINNVARQSRTKPPIDDHFVQLLRVAALLHDTGHAAFSHVSEAALENLSDIERLSTEFSREIKGDEKKLSEIFAYFVCQSRSLAKLLEYICETCTGFIQFDSNRRENIKLIQTRLANAIVGQQVSDDLPLLHELISGPFDADKLDYFVRDAKQAGTPTVLDISRLVQKISIRNVQSTGLPKELQNKSKEHRPGLYYIWYQMVRSSCTR